MLIYLSRAKAFVSNPQAGGGGSKIAAVVADAGDAEGFGQASRAAGELAKVGEGLQCEVASPRHFLDAEERFEGAEQNRARLAFALAGNVQAVVVAVDEIDVGVAGRAEQD